MLVASRLCHSSADWDLKSDLSPIFVNLDLIILDGLGYFVTLMALAIRDFGSGHHLDSRPPRFCKAPKSMADFKFRSRSVDTFGDARYSNASEASRKFFDCNKATFLVMTPYLASLWRCPLL